MVVVPLPIPDVLLLCLWAAPQLPFSNTLSATQMATHTLSQILVSHKLKC
jgi:hypothetical protein